MVLGGKLSGHTAKTLSQFLTSFRDSAVITCTVQPLAPHTWCIEPDSRWPLSSNPNMRLVNNERYLPSQRTDVFPGLLALSFILKGIQAQLASGHHRASLICPLCCTTLSLPLICVDRVGAWI